jgi:glycerol-3-phosphate dehydrogenase
VILEARQGVKIVRTGKLTSFTSSKNGLSSATIRNDNGVTENIHFGNFVNAAGPYARRIIDLISKASPLQLKNEIHAKVAMRDELDIYSTKYSTFNHTG